MIYRMDALGYLIDEYVGYILDDGHTELLEGPTETYEACEKMVYGRVLIGVNECKRCVEKCFCFLCSLTNVGGEEVIFLF